jgi:crotonobetainyl-CoA:carnitine CoA-transferase CaiB-like acyl-CoA transferase
MESRFATISPGWTRHRRLGAYRCTEALGQESSPWLPDASTVLSRGAFLDDGKGAALPTTTSGHWARVDGPLRGVRVLDLTQVIMGPFATQVLADQGADVILVEAGGEEINRVMGAGRHPELSGSSLNLLRNKRSARLDLKSAEGQAAIRQLVPTCDVVVTTMRPRALAKLQVDYETFRQLQPRLIYCQAQGFGLGGERADEPAYDDIIQAATGICDVMERVHGSPALMPTILADKVCGLVIAQAVTAALFNRERTDEGQHVEVAMHQAMTAFMLVEHGDGAMLEPPEQIPGLPATGYKRVLSAERRPHPTKDGQVHLFPYLPEHYAMLFGEAGMPDADTDPRYADRRATILNSDSLYRDVRRIAPTRTTEDWLAYCRQAGIPAVRVASLQELVDDLPLASHPVAGDHRVTPVLANFARTPAGVRRPAPLVGEHTDEVLAEAADLLARGRARASGDSAVARRARQSRAVQ